MNAVTLLTTQTHEAYNWAERLLCSVPYNQWDVTPDVMETNLTWQAGHLIVSYYFHSVMVIAGHDTDVLKAMPLKEYSQYFTSGQPAACTGRFHPATLHNHLQLVAARSLAIIGNLPVGQLPEKLLPTPTGHPVATTQQQALSWNIQHTMWHCGQIAMLKRIVDKRYDFGLR